MTTKHWTIEIYIDQRDDGTTRARARLDTSDDVHLHGHGTAGPTPQEAAVPEISEQVAVAQALSQISHTLFSRAELDTRKANEAQYLSLTGA